MFKINYYSLFFLGFLFINAPNVHCFSSSQPNNLSFPPTPSQQSLFPNIFQQAENDDSTVLLFPTSSATPQPYQWHFNSSTHTFIPPLMLSGWGYNMSTDTFNINHFSLPIVPESGNCNDAFANTDNRTFSLIPNESNPSNTTNTSAHIITPSVVIHKQKVSHTNQDKNHGLSESNKKEKRTKTYMCPTCHKTLANQNTFNYHLRTHDPNRARPFQCHLCPKSFAEKHILKNHIKRHKNEKPFKCEFCNKFFKAKYERIAHHRTHTGEKPYKCTLCGKLLKSKQGLTRHIRTHTGEKPFKCKICGKGLSSKGSLKDHLSMHEGRKLYKCDQCQKSFRTNGRLKEHYKLHKNEKPYTCGQCTKSYVTKDGLRYHLKTHNRPKAYICHYCEVAFAHKSEYEKHILYEEETDDDRKCHICKKVYSDKYHLTQHNKRSHPRK